MRISDWSSDVCSSDLDASKRAGCNPARIAGVSIMIDYLTDPDRGVVEFTVDGPLTKEDYDRIVAEIDDAIGRFGKLRLVAIVKDFGAIDSAIRRPDRQCAAPHMKHTTSRSEEHKPELQQIMH